MNETYYESDGTEITEYELEQRFDDMLDDIYEPVTIFGRYEYAVSRVLKDIDPILYRCAYLEYVDGLLVDGDLFESDPTESD